MTLSNFLNIFRTFNNEGLIEICEVDNHNPNIVLFTWKENRPIYYGDDFKTYIDPINHLPQVWNSFKFNYDLGINFNKIKHLCDGEMDEKYILIANRMMTEDTIKLAIEAVFLNNLDK